VSATSKLEASGLSYCLSYSVHWQQKKRAGRQTKIY